MTGLDRGDAACPMLRRAPIAMMPPPRYEVCVLSATCTTDGNCLHNRRQPSTPMERWCANSRPETTPTDRHRETSYTCTDAMRRCAMHQSPRSQRFWAARSSLATNCTRATRALLAEATSTWRSQVNKVAQGRGDILRHVGCTFCVQAMNMERSKCPGWCSLSDGEGQIQSTPSKT